MALYSSETSLDCHRVRFVLAEKGINVEIVNISEDESAAADLAELNPYNEAPTLVDRDLVLCADCVPVAYPDFHRDYLRDKAVGIGCPKLDDGEEMVERLTAIFTHARPRSVTVARMTVPCCGCSQRSSASVPVIVLRDMSIFGC